MGSYSWADTLKASMTPDEFEAWRLKMLAKRRIREEKAKQPKVSRKVAKKRKQVQRRWAQEQHEPIDDISVQFRQIVANS